MMEDYGLIAGGCDTDYARYRGWLDRLQAALRPRTLLRFEVVVDVDREAKRLAFRAGRARAYLANRERLRAKQRVPPRLGAMTEAA
jgi:hypothetical protein